VLGIQPSFFLLYKTPAQHKKDMHTMSFARQNIAQYREDKDHNKRGEADSKYLPFLQVSAYQGLTVTGLSIIL
jgi:hypothetical protein